MSQISLIAEAAPAFLSKNYINADAKDASDLVVSTGDDFKHRLYDMVRESYWTSVGSNDTTTETITIGLYEGSYQADRSIDFLAIMAHNLKRFKFEYSSDNGANWSAVTGGDYSGADFSGTDLILSLASPITANKLRLTMDSVQSGGGEKTVGGLIAALGTLQTGDALEAYEPMERETIRDIRLLDGSLDYGVIRRADAGFVIYSAGVRWVNMTASDKDAIRAIRNSAAPFLWYPEPGNSPKYIYLARFVPGALRITYSNRSISAGFTVAAEIEEVGGC